MPDPIPIRRAKSELPPAVKSRLEKSLVSKLRRGRGRDRNSRLSLIAGVAVATAVLGVRLGMEIVPPLVGCSVKANINLVTGERIYHVPGQEYYDVTRIDPFRGERWFCSEDAARAAGWRMAWR